VAKFAATDKSGKKLKTWKVPNPHKFNLIYEGSSVSDVSVSRHSHPRPRTLALSFSKVPSSRYLWSTFLFESAKCHLSEWKRRLGGTSVFLSD